MALSEGRYFLPTSDSYAWGDWDSLGKLSGSRIGLPMDQPLLPGIDSGLGAVGEM
jgi:hypothetical protein